ncbi:MAG: Flp pilus assembly protein CpaB [Acidobacteriia bacterium]|nr:Flp pilus assembly protein CpaB [Terriglobia bacterium]
MNKRFVAVLVFAFVVASGASLLLYRLMSNRPQTTKAAPATAKIAVATRDLELGTVLKEEDLKLQDWSGEVPAGASARTQDLVGRGVITKIFAKEPVIELRLAAKGAGGGFSAIIPTGMRAVAVPVNEVVGVAGFVVPGMRVDVLISGAPPNEPSALGTVTKTLLQNIEVLSSGQDFKKDPEGKPITVQVVNLLVTPQQAEELSLASHQTTIQLVLRNPLDRDVAATTGTAVANLFSGTKLKTADFWGPDRDVSRARTVVHDVPLLPPPVRKEAPYVMEIISGNKRVEAKFDGSGEEKQ